MATYSTRTPLDMQGAYFRQSMRRADEAKRNAEVLERVMQPAQAVTAKADEIEIEQRMAESLAKKLSMLMGGSGTYGGYRYEIHATRDFHKNCFRVHVQDRRFLSPMGQQVRNGFYFDVPDDTLATQTLSGTAYGNWLADLSRSLTKHFTPVKTRATNSESEWMESRIVPLTPALVEEINEELRSLGVIPHEDIAAESEKEAEEAAIASILEARND